MCPIRKSLQHLSLWAKTLRHRWRLFWFVKKRNAPESWFVLWFSYVLMLYSSCLSFSICSLSTGGCHLDGAQWAVLLAVLGVDWSPAALGAERTGDFSKWTFFGDGLLHCSEEAKTPSWGMLEFYLESFLFFCILCDLLLTLIQVAGHWPTRRGLWLLGEGTGVFEFFVQWQVGGNSQRGHCLAKENLQVPCSRGESYFQVRVWGCDRPVGEASIGQEVEHAAQDEGKKWYKNTIWCTASSTGLHDLLLSPEVQLS